MNRYQIFYRGQLASTSLTEKGAQALAYRLIKYRKWDPKDIQIKDTKQEAANV